MQNQLILDEQNNAVMKRHIIRRRRTESKKHPSYPSPTLYKGQFIFPKEEDLMPIKTTLRTKKQIIAYFDALSIKQLRIRFRAMYTSTVKKSRGAFLSYDEGGILFKCKRCTAYFSLSLVNGMYITADGLKYRLDHAHQGLRYRTSEEAQLLSYIYQNFTPSLHRISKMLLDTRLQCDLSSYHWLTIVRHIDRRDLNNPLALVYFCNYFKFQYKWQRDQQQLKWMVVVSEEMKQDYLRWGRLLRIESDTGIISLTRCQDAKLIPTIFLVRDCGGSLRVVGIAFRLKTAKYVTQILKAFWSIIGQYSKPDAIETEYDPTLMSGIEEAQKLTKHKGRIRVDGRSFLKYWKQKMQKKENSSPKSIEIIRQLLNTKNIEDYQNKMLWLANGASGLDKEVDFKMLEAFFKQYRVHYVFFQEIPSDCWVGLRSCFPQTLQTLKIKPISENSTTMTYLQYFHMISQEMHDRAQVNLKASRDKSEYLLANPELGKIRKRMAKKTFEVLLQNYVDSLNSCKIDRQNKDTYYVKRNQLTFIVQDGRCNCFQTNKTGIPCCHLLTVMKKNGERYSDRVSKWWFLDYRKDWLQVEEKKRRGTSENQPEDQQSDEI